MKTLIYISGIIGTLLLVASFIGLFAEIQYNNVLFYSSIILLVFIFFPLILFNRYQQNKKVDEIIKAYKGKNQESKQIKQGDSGTKGWGMNNSPFRSRKSGLSWGGGNIRASEASRGTRKSFLK